MRRKPFDLHELLIDDPEVLDIDRLGEVAIVNLWQLIGHMTLKMDELEPDFTNIVYVRVPIEVDR